MGWLLAQNVVMAAALAGIAAVVCRLRRVGPVARHALWLVVLIKLVTPPFLVIESPWSWPPLAAAAAPAPATPLMKPSGYAAVVSAHATSVRGPVLRAPEPRGLFPAVPEDRLGAAVDPPPTHAATGAESTEAPVTALVAAARVSWQQISGWAAVIWIAGAIGFLATQAVRVLRMARAVSHGRAADPALLADVERVRGRLNLAPIAVSVVPGVDSPLVWSLHPLRPVLVWPERLANGAPDACVSGLVTHELAHVKRRDHWVGWIELAAGAVWWWNPLFWFVRSRLRENAELACDAWVIDAEPHGRRAYAEALLAVCAVASSRTAPMPAVGISTGSRRFLERRLAMIMQERVPVRLSRLALASLALMVAATLPVWAARMTGPDGPQAVPPAAKPVPVVVPAPTAQPPVVVEVAPAQGWTHPVPVEVAPEAPATQWLLGDHAAQTEKLPEDARKLVQRFTDQQAEARREAEAKIATQREELIKQLKAMQDTYTKAGSLDEAVAIRDQIRRLTTGAAHVGGDFWFGFNNPDPLTNRSYAYMPNEKTLYGNVTVDRALNGAPDDFLMYFDRANTVVHDPLLSALHALRGQTGAHIVVEVVGAAGPGLHVWGTDVYTDDSSIAAAAVHAGLLKPGERGLLRVVLLPGQDSYSGSDRHGLKSESFGKFQASFKLERVDKR